MGGFGFAPPIQHRLPVMGVQPMQPVAPRPMASQGGSITGDIAAVKKGFSTVKSGLNSLGIGAPPPTPYISSPMIPTGPDIGDASGAISDAVNNVAAAGPSLASGATAGAVGDAATAGLGDAAATGAEGAGIDDLLSSLIFL